MGTAGIVLPSPPRWTRAAGLSTDHPFEPGAIVQYRIATASQAFEDSAKDVRAQALAQLAAVD